MLDSTVVAQPVNDIDRYFGMLQRSPFRDTSPSDVFNQSPSVPMETIGPAQDINLPMFQGFGLAGGVPNGNLAEGPPDGDDSTIDNVDNRLPGWTLDDSNGPNLHATWDEASGSVNFWAGENVQIGEEIYILTLVPVTDVGRILRPIAKYVLSPDTLGTPFTRVVLECQFANISGTLMGSPLTSFYDDDGLGGSRWIDQWRMPAWDAEAYIRVAIGLAITAVPDDDGAGWPLIAGAVGNVWSTSPAVSDVTLTGIEDALDPSASSATLFPTMLGISTGIARYTPSQPGFVMAYYAKTSSTISAGTGTLMVRNVTQGVDIDVFSGLQHFDSSNSRIWGVRLLNKEAAGVPAYDFAAGDELNIKLSTNGSWASTSGDWFTVVRLLEAFGDPLSWGVA